MRQDTFLLADVGGTNTRLALGTRNGLLSQTTARYSNDNFNGFSDILVTYRAQYTNQPIHSAAMAVAGQINGHRAQLTNRNWSFDSDHLADAVGCEQVHFINDLSGLARAIPVLSPHQLRSLQTTLSSHSNDQSLVIGLGTGVNVSALLGKMTLSAEIGHTSSTRPMINMIEAHLGEAQLGFDTVEDILSGRGLETLYKLSTGGVLKASEICATYKQNDGARSTCQLYGSLLAELIRELALHYLPHNGIYLSGSVARGILETPAREQVITSLTQEHPMRSTIERMSLSVITDDAAALLGCLEIAKTNA